jgi:DNA (cytosine-5)-methyltransferase 1
MGYRQAGLKVDGLDIDPQPRYPFAFVQGDAIRVMNRLLDGWTIKFQNPDGSAVSRTLDDYDAIAASPICRPYTLAQKIQKNDHPELVEPTRELLQQSGKPYVIENVPGAPLVDPIELCGCMFPWLNVYRPRLFEAPGCMSSQSTRSTRRRQTKMGRKPQPGERMHVVGNFSGVKEAKAAMDIDWMVRDELREAIPPAYTEWIGRRLIEHLGATT